MSSNAEKAISAVFTLLFLTVILWILVTVWSGGNIEEVTNIVSSLAVPITLLLVFAYFISSFTKEVG